MWSHYCGPRGQAVTFYESATKCDMCEIRPRRLYADEQEVRKIVRDELHQQMLAENRFCCDCGVERPQARTNS